MSLPKKLYHYSQEPIKELIRHPVIEEAFYFRFDKPPGLWFSVEDYPNDFNWKDWCKGARFGIKRLRFKSLVKLKERSKILHIKNREELELFSMQYKREINTYTKSKGISLLNDLRLEALKKLLPERVCIYGISWIDVSKAYDGIIIAPSQNSYPKFGEPLDLQWYYGWDCSSGCIWNFDCIESLEVVPKRAYNKKPRPKDEVLLQ